MMTRDAAGCRSSRKVRSGACEWPRWPSWEAIASTAWPSLHSEILKRELFRDFAEMWPEKFNNKTNGVTQRRWLLKCNPPLSQLISDAIGDGWITDLYQLRKLIPLAQDSAFASAVAAGQA